MKLRHNVATVSVILAASCSRIDSTRLKTPPTGNFDLVAESVTYHPTNVVVGSHVVFYKVVRNIGSDKVPGGTYYVDLFLNGTNISFDHATCDILPGLATKYSMSSGYYHFKPETPGVYLYKFVVDKENNLPETDESNNVIEGTINVTEATEQPAGSNGKPAPPPWRWEKRR